jgi:hypothetical protein
MGSCGEKSKLSSSQSVYLSSRNPQIYICNFSTSKLHDFIYRMKQSPWRWELLAFYFGPVLTLAVK